jgi:uncharacterized membrane protein
MTVESHSRVDFTCWFLAPALLVAAAAATPLLLSRGYIAIWYPLHYGFSLVCHQRPDRSFYLFGAPIAVCARCLGIYLGAAIGLLLRTSRSIALRLLIVTASLNLLDGLTELVGPHGNWMKVRFVLGLALGVAGALLILSSLPQTPARAATIS